MLKRYIHILLLLILAGLILIILYGHYKNQQRPTKSNEGRLSSGVSAEVVVDELQFNDALERPEQPSKQGAGEDSTRQEGLQEDRQAYQKALASWYGREACPENTYQYSCLTANGELFDEEANTAACSSHFSLGDVVELCRNDTCITVRCNDTGQFECLGRTFDLSRGVFEQLGDLSLGVIEIKWKLLK